ncbi:MAG: DinB family protein, partial [Acidimicrobiales bacterium]
RISGIVAGDPEIPNVDGHALAGTADFRSQDLFGLLEQLRQERTRSAAFLRSLAPADLGRASEHHKYGELTAGDFAHEWAFHDQDHLQQILEAVKPRYMEAMTANMRNAMAAG